MKKALFLFLFFFSIFPVWADTQVTPGGDTFVYRKQTSGSDGYFLQATGWGYVARNYAGSVLGSGIQFNSNTSKRTTIITTFNDFSYAIASENTNDIYIVKILDDGTMSQIVRYNTWWGYIFLQIWFKNNLLCFRGYEPNWYGGRTYKGGWCSDGSDVGTIPTPYEVDYTKNHIVQLGNSYFLAQTAPNQLTSYLINSDNTVSNTYQTLWENFDFWDFRAFSNSLEYLSMGSMSGSYHTATKESRNYNDTILDQKFLLEKVTSWNNQNLFLVNDSLKSQYNFSVWSVPLIGFKETATAGAYQFVYVMSWALYISWQSNYSAFINSSGSSSSSSSSSGGGSSSSSSSSSSGGGSSSWWLNTGNENGTVDTSALFTPLDENWDGEVSWTEALTYPFRWLSGFVQKIWDIINKIWDFIKNLSGLWRTTEQKSPFSFSIFPEAYADGTGNVLLGALYGNMSESKMPRLWELSNIIKWAVLFIAFIGGLSLLLYFLMQKNK